jgi:hypothetical protein
MHPHQKISALKQVSFSNFIQDDDLWYLLYACESISLKADQVLFAEKSYKGTSKNRVKSGWMN